MGVGNSDVLTDTILWNIPRFVEEVEQVSKGLGLDYLYLCGHVWGIMLAMEYLDKYQCHAKNAVLSEMTAGIKIYVTYSAKLKEQILSRQDNPLSIRLRSLSLQHIQLWYSPAAWYCGW